jgi:chromosome segregation ATPase
MDKKRRKQIEKRIEGLQAQKEKHEEKVATLEGQKDTTHDYWKKEIKRMQDEIDEIKKPSVYPPLKCGVCLGVFGFSERNMQLLTAT